MGEPTAGGGGGATFTASIIIPCWNRAEFTLACLEALAASVPDSVGFEVVVVDNGSTDGTPELLASLGGDVQVITNDRNRGFARACNQGAEAARGQFLVFLNNDTEPHPGWLEALLAVFSAYPDAGVAGSRLLYPDGTIQHAGIAFPKRAEGKFIVAGDHRFKDVFIDQMPYHLYKRMPADAPFVNRRRDFQAVTGACLMIERALFGVVGGFDEGYLNSYEDVDLCLRVLQAGRRIVYEPASVVTHHESVSEGRHAHDVPNGRRFWDRWRDFIVPDDDRFYLEDGFEVERPRPHLTVYRWNPLFAEAEGLFAAGAWSDALSTYKGFLEAVPDHDEARIKVAVLEHRLAEAVR